MRARIIAEERCSHPGGRAHASAAIWILALGLFSGAVASEPGAGSVPEPAPIGADSLLGRRVERVRVVTRTIYDPLPAGRFRALYRLANKLHIPTRAGTIRQELLLGPGEPWDPARADESARKLRALQFIDTVSVRARPESSGVAVDVMTRDAWSSGVDFGFQGAFSWMGADVVWDDDCPVFNSGTDGYNVMAINTEHLRLEVVTMEPDVKKIYAS